LDSLSIKVEVSTAAHLESLSLKGEGRVRVRVRVTAEAALWLHHLITASPHHGAKPQAPVDLTNSWTRGAGS
jgi:hypothetical protein